MVMMAGKERKKERDGSEIHDNIDGNEGGEIIKFVEPQPNRPINQIVAGSPPGPLQTPSVPAGQSTRQYCRLHCCGTAGAFGLWTDTEYLPPSGGHSTLAPSWHFQHIWCSIEPCACHPSISARRPTTRQTLDPRPRQLPGLWSIPSESGVRDIIADRPSSDPGAPLPNPNGHFAVGRKNCWAAD